LQTGKFYLLQDGHLASAPVQARLLIFNQSELTFAATVAVLVLVLRL
jgi:hypothetical protein